MRFTVYSKVRGDIPPEGKHYDITQNRFWSGSPGRWRVIAANAQQEFVQTSPRENKNCNAVCSVIDIPELNGILRPSFL
jgi:hypothetical protein